MGAERTVNKLQSGTRADGSSDILRRVRVLRTAAPAGRKLEINRPHRIRLPPHPEKTALTYDVSAITSMLTPQAMPPRRSSPGYRSRRFLGTVAEGAELLHRAVAHDGTDAHVPAPAKLTDGFSCGGQNGYYLHGSQPGVHARAVSSDSRTRCDRITATTLFFSIEGFSMSVPITL